MASRLRACGITPRILTTYRLDMNPGQPIDVAVREFRPSAILSIMPIGVNRIRDERDERNERNKPDKTLFFKLALVDLASDKVTWVAKYRGHGYSDFGSEFALRIVLRLREDGVLKGCPGGRPTRPGDPDQQIPTGGYPDRR
jgi:hypothetical protein